MRSDAERTVLLDGGTVLTMNAGDDRHEHGCVLIEGDRIAYVGPRDSLPSTPIDETVDSRGRVVMPGLVNGHTHLCMVFGRGLGTNVDLLSWLGLQMPLIRALDEESLYHAELLGCIENLKNGNTSVVENLFTPRPGPGFDPAGAAFRAMRDSGIRGAVARAHETRNFAPDFVESEEQFGDALRELHAQWHGREGGRLRLLFGPLLPWSMTEASLRRTREIADELRIGLHMHVAESPEFNQQIARHFGRNVRQVELLHETGCLGPDVQAVAVSDVSPGEIALLAQTRTAVILDPPTRLFWGTGFPAIRPLLDAGLTCGLASNGPAANCGQDIFESMKYACATAKTAAGDPTVLSARRALRMATIEGATAIGIGDRVGSLEVGKLADVITIEMRQPHLAPVADMEATLVFSARGSDVRDVFVSGRTVMRDRRLTLLDEAALVADASALAADARRRCGLTGRPHGLQH